MIPGGGAGPTHPGNSDRIVVLGLTLDPLFNSSRARSISFNCYPNSRASIQSDHSIISHRQAGVGLWCVRQARVHCARRGERSCAFSHPLSSLHCLGDPGFGLERRRAQSQPVPSLRTSKLGWGAFIFELVGATLPSIHERTRKMEEWALQCKNTEWCIQSSTVRTALVCGSRG